VTLVANWLVCERICVPEEGVFTLDLPAGTPAPSAEAPLFAAADAATPRPAPWAVTISPQGVLSVRGAGLTAETVRDAWFAPFTWGQVEPSAPQDLAQGAEGFTLALKPGPEFNPAKGLAGVLVVQDRSGQQAGLEIAAVAGPPVVLAPPVPMLRALGLALLGGLILNLMPCVFPVLAIKAMGLARMAQAGRRRALGEAGAYAAGVILTFLAVAGTLLGARAAGLAAGWGYQLQSPIFVALMAWLLFAVGLNMSGVYAIGGRVAGVGQSLAGRGGAVGSFFTGALAVLVASPCTAPFMGAAIAAALAAPPAVALSIFAAMGLGLAAPYVLLAALPGAARLLPRPGPWMDILRQGLAFPMYGAAVWLLWVVAQQAGPDGLLATAIGFCLLGFAGWALGLAQLHQAGAHQAGGRLARAAALGAVLAAGAVLSAISTSPPAAAKTEAGIEAFSPERLAQLRAEGRPVFVNMTAAWCVTCLVNERVALSSDRLRSAFAAGNIAYLKGDWTRQDPAITAFLRSHGRDGVPLYIAYPAGGGPVLLPQILTEGVVLSAFSAR
jgi:thiol:disulfide interchange protein DsbD